MKTITIEGIELPVNENGNDFIPPKHEIIGQNEDLAKLAYAIDKDMPVLMVGETGVGKTSLIRHLANVTNNGFRRMNLNGQTGIDEFVGKTLLNEKGTYWQDGVLIDAMRNGYWLLLDEINAALPEILFILHSLLDDDKYVVLAEHNGEIVRPHKNFRLFATMNPSGRYTGTKELNKAFLSRFPMILQVAFPSQSQEESILKLYSPKIGEAALNLVRMGQDLRSAYEKDEIEYLCSTRDLINCAIISQDIGMNNALNVAILNRVQQEDYKAVKTVVSLYFGTSGSAKSITNYEKEYNDQVILTRKAVDKLHDFNKNAAEIIDMASELCKGLTSVEDFVREEGRSKEGIVNGVAGWAREKRRELLTEIDSLSVPSEIPAKMKAK